MSCCPWVQLFGEIPESEIGKGSRVFALLSVTSLTVLGVSWFVPFLPPLQDMLPRHGPLDTSGTVEPTLPRSIAISACMPVECSAFFQATASRSQGYSRNGYYAAAHTASVTHSAVPVHHLSQGQAGNKQVRVG